MPSFSNTIVSLLIYAAMGTLGYFVFLKLKIPSPGILGPMIFLGTASFFGIELAIPEMLRPALSMFLGILMGLRFNVKAKGLLKMLLLTWVWLAALTALSTWLLMLIGLDLFTALFSTTPGGLAEMALMSLAFGSDSFGVVLLQTSRLFLTILIIPIIARVLEKKLPPDAPDMEQMEMPPEEEAQEENSREKPKIPYMAEWMIFIALAILATWVFGLINFPAPFLTGPMIFIGIYTKIRGLKITANPNFQLILQIGIGGILGLSLTRESILSVPIYVLPIIVLNVVLMGGCAVLALIMKKLTRWDLITCLLATAPGGLTPMVLLAMEMKVNSRVVAVFQVLRIIMVIVLTPLVGRLLLL